MSFDWKKTLATVAPALATALGGPMAGVAVSMCGKALGMGDGVTESDLAAVVAGGNPEVLVKLKEVDNNFKLEMERLGVDVLRIDSDDRKDARALGIAKGLGPQIILATIFVCGFIYVLGVIFAGQTIDPAMREIATYVLGILSAGLVQIMNYFFGSSSGSKEKTSAIERMMEK